MGFKRNVAKEIAMRLNIRLTNVATRVLQSLAITSAIATSSFAETPPPIGASNRDSAKVEYFEKLIRPLLIDNCYNCHSADNGGKGGLRVDDRNGLIEGGSRGPGISPGKPAESLLIKAVRHQGGLEMPQKSNLRKNKSMIWKSGLPMVPYGRRQKSLKD